MRPWPVWIWMRRLSRQHRAGKPRLCRGQARLRPGSRRRLRMLPRQRSKSFQHQKHYLAQNPPPHDFYARYGVELVTGCHLRLYLHVSFGLIGRQARYRHGIGAIGVDGADDARMLDGACGRLCNIGCERDISCGYALARRGVLGSAARRARGRCRRGSLRRGVGFWCSVFARSSSLGCGCRIACSGISRRALVGLLLCLRAYFPHERSLEGKAPRTTAAARRAIPPKSVERRDGISSFSLLFNRHHFAFYRHK